MSQLQHDIYAPDGRLIARSVACGGAKMPFCLFFGKLDRPDEIPLDECSIGDLFWHKASDLDILMVLNSQKVWETLRDEMPHPNNSKLFARVRKNGQPNWISAKSLSEYKSRSIATKRRGTFDLSGIHKKARTEPDSPKTDIAAGDDHTMTESGPGDDDGPSRDDYLPNPTPATEAGDVHSHDDSIRLCLGEYSFSVPFVDVVGEAEDELTDITERIRSMAGLRSAQLDPQFLELDVKEEDLHSKIRDGLVKGCMIVVHGCDPGPVRSWSRDSVRGHLRNWNDYVEVQDMFKRLSHPLDPHARVTFGEFMDKAEDPSVCMNLLDCPTPGRGAPPLIWPISADRQAWSRTASINHTHPQYIRKNKGLPAKGRKPKRGKSGAAQPGSSRRAISQPLRGDSLPVAQVAPHPSPVSRLDGPRVQLTDHGRFSDWWIATHSGFYTFPHHDSDGALTYMHIHVGAKIWAYARLPRHKQSMTFADTRSYYSKSMGAKRYTRMDEYVLLLRRGDLLIQPPNIGHHVYTPEKSIASGGHFYAWETMHLTEMARLIDHGIGDVTTNENHGGTERQMARMAISLIRRDEDQLIPRNAFLAFARMILDPRKYSPHPPPGFDFDPVDDSRWIEDRIAIETDEDCLLAEKVVLQRLEHLGLSREKLFENWEDGSWNEAGVDLISLPVTEEPRVDWE